VLLKPVVGLSVIMLSVVRLIVITPSVVWLNVVAPPPEPMNDEGMMEKRKDFITDNQKPTEPKSTENNSRLARSSITINLRLSSKRSSLEPHFRHGRRLR